MYAVALSCLCVYVVSIHTIMTMLLDSAPCESYNRACTAVTLFALQIIVDALESSEERLPAIKPSRQQPQHKHDSRIVFMLITTESVRLLRL